MNFKSSIIILLLLFLQNNYTAQVDDIPKSTYDYCRAFYELSTAINSFDFKKADEFLKIIGVAKDKDKEILHIQEYLTKNNLKGKNTELNKLKEYESNLENFEKNWKNKQFDEAHKISQQIDLNFKEDKFNSQVQTYLEKKTYHQKKHEFETEYTKLHKGKRDIELIKERRTIRAIGILKQLQRRVEIMLKKSKVIDEKRVYKPSMIGSIFYSDETPYYQAWLNSLNKLNKEINSLLKFLSGLYDPKVEQSIVELENITKFLEEVWGIPGTHEIGGVIENKE